MGPQASRPQVSQSWRRVWEGHDLGQVAFCAEGLRAAGQSAITGGFWAEPCRLYRERAGHWAGSTGRFGGCTCGWPRDAERSGLRWVGSHRGQSKSPCSRKKCKTGSWTEEVLGNRGSWRPWWPVWGLCRSHAQHLCLGVPMGRSEGTKHAWGKAPPLVGSQWGWGGLGVGFLSAQIMLRGSW